MYVRRSGTLNGNVNNVAIANELPHTHIQTYANTHANALICCHLHLFIYVCGNVCMCV